MYEDDDTMSYVGNIEWSSDGKKPYSGCCAGIHVFYLSFATAMRNGVEGAICQCREMTWTFITCEHCKQRRGHAVKREPTKQENPT